MGAVLALAAWGSTKTIGDGPGEQRIERTETTSTGITTEKVVIGEDGDSTYTSSWHRIGATPEFEAETAKEYIKNVQLGVPAERHSI